MYSGFTFCTVISVLKLNSVEFASINKFICIHVYRFSIEYAKSLWAVSATVIIELNSILWIFFGSQQFTNKLISPELSSTIPEACERKGAVLYKFFWKIIEWQSKKKSWMLWKCTQNDDEGRHFIASECYTKTKEQRLEIIAV